MHFLPHAIPLKSLNYTLETQLDLVAKLGLELYAQHHIGEMGEGGED